MDTQDALSHLLGATGNSPIGTLGYALHRVLRNVEAHDPLNTPGCAIVWETADLEACELYDPELDTHFRVRPTPEQAIQTFAAANRLHDANAGINWQVLEHHLENVIQEGE